MYERLLKLPLSSAETCFLWGARQAGKSTLLKTLFPEAKKYDLLLSDVYSRLLTNPALVRQECLEAGLTGETQRSPVIIDEIQKLPALLDEIHWLIENQGLRFILCGSSARKLRRGHANLLGGRAVRYALLPLTSREIPEFSLMKAVNFGLLPRHYLSSTPGKLIESYVGDYLREEIAAEALVRNVPAFSRFLDVAAISNGEMINFSNIASECGVTSPTAKEYFQILEDTLLGRFLPAFQKRLKRRVIQAPKFYFFDIGVVAYLTRRGKVEIDSELFGRVFEHFIYMEVYAHSIYSEQHYPIAYWRTTSGFEVDLVLGEGEIAIEIKSSHMVRDKHLKGLRAFREEQSAKHYIVVSNDPEPRKTSDGIVILPWHIFLDRLWNNELTG